MAKWAELAEEILGSEDKRRKSYPMRFNDKSGYLIMSNRKLLFLEEKGFIRLKYSKALELPYSNIFKVSMKPNRMTLIDGDKNEYNFTEASINLERIGRELQDLIAASKE